MPVPKTESTRSSTTLGKIRNGELLYFRRVQVYYVQQHQKCTKFKSTNKLVLEPARS
eukprot:SAG11_NODE_9440_length_911_cov_1.173645_1_plen_56_part_10